MLRLDSDASHLALMVGREELQALAAAAGRARKALLNAPRRGLAAKDAGWDSWRSELARALDAAAPAVALAQRWSTRAQPATWMVGRLPSSTSRRVAGLEELAASGLPWPSLTVLALAYLAIAVGLEAPCKDSGEWDARRAGWRIALRRAARQRIAR